MNFEPESSNDETMKFVIKNRQEEVNKERLAEALNSLDSLSILYQNIPNKKIKAEVGELIEKIIVGSQDYSIGESLQKYYTMKNTNQVFEYIAHMRQDIVREGEEL